MKYYKTLSDSYVLMVGTIGDTEIPESEYQTIVTKIQNKPSAPEGFQYRLRNDSLEWELDALPEAEPEPVTPEEIAAAIEEALA